MKKLIACGISVVFLFVAFAQAQTLHGVITNAVTKAPVEKAEIILPEISKVYTSKGDGTYATDTVPAGTYLVKIEAPEYLKPVTDHVHVSAATVAEAVDQHVAESVVELREWFDAAGFPAQEPVVIGASYQLASGEVHWLD